MKNKIIFLIYIISIIFILASCNIGLGEAVDLKAPVVKVESHGDNDTVAESFVLYGTASDNEVVSLITVDFEDADIHYQIIPGELWQKKTSVSSDWQTIAEDVNNYCTLNNGVWNWSIDVDTKDKVSTKDGSDFSFKVIAKDQIGNSDSNSIVNRTLIVDTSNPNVSIYKPELFTGTYETVSAKVEPYALKDGNVLSKLLNGELTVKGHQSDALSFKELRIQFDNGKLKSGISKTTAGTGVNSIADIDSNEDSKLGDAEPVDIYYSKTLNANDLREWEISVKPEEWAETEEGKNKGLNTGKHLIRVVTTSLSSSNAWEHKVIGYFVWWPEADLPWITPGVGAATLDDVLNDTKDAYDCFPGGTIAGNAQDDDAIKSFTSKINKLNESTNLFESFSEKLNHKLPSENSKNFTWGVKVPTEPGIYELELNVEDYNSNIISKTVYFKTSDVSVPKIHIDSPLDNSSAIINAEGNIHITGTATDNNKVEKLAMVWLNPALANTPDNKIKYLTGESSNWEIGTTDGNSDADGNIVFSFDTKKQSSYSIDKVFNLYTDFGIDGNLKKLSSQEFIFRAVDASNNKTVKTLTLTGDTITPEVSFKTITIKNKTEEFRDGYIPSFEKITSGTKALIKGEWKDYFTETIQNTNKLHGLELTWGGEKVSVELKTDGTWEVEMIAPASGGTISVSLKDFADNIKTVTSAVSIETSDLGIARVDCTEDDGAYNAGKSLNITLEFTKNTDVDTTNGIPTLTLNNGGVAKYTNGTGTTSHTYKYIVGSTDSDVEKLTVTQINANGAIWSDSAVASSKLDLNVTAIPSRFNLGDIRSIQIDNTAPAIKLIKPLSSASNYKAGSSILIWVEFTEAVSITDNADFGIIFDHKNSFAEYTDSQNFVMAKSSSVSGSNAMILTYNVKNGDNANTLAFKSINPGSTKIVDNAGNEIKSWNVIPAPDFTGFVIDTFAPEAPVITFSNSNNETITPGVYVFDEDGIYFTLKDSTDISSREYSLDNGINWTPYTGKVHIVNNGSYSVVSRQTDKAGNIGEKSITPVNFTVDKGSLLTRVTADTPSGTYSTNTTTKVIIGRIQFRKDVTIPKGTSVTINVKNSSDTENYKKIPVKECISADSTGKEFTFEYVIQEGDFVQTVDPGEQKMNVLGWNLPAGKSVKLNGIDVLISQPESSFSENRDIRILTGKPEVLFKNGMKDISFEGEGESAVLRVAFDRNISVVKNDSKIVFEYDIEKTNNNFHVPVVLSVAEYNELNTTKAFTDKLAENSKTLKSYYKEDTNGAILQNDNTLKNDTASKYVLISTADGCDTDEALVSAFIAANKHKVEVPVISSQVTVQSNSRLAAGGNILQIELGSAYVLPVKGAYYKLTIPAGVVTDDISNTNDENAVKEFSVYSEGVETPAIRIVKPVYTINITGTTNANRTKNSTVNIADQKTASMFMNCRTPGATILYEKNTKVSSTITAHSNPLKILKNGNAYSSTHDTDSDVTVPTDLTQIYSKMIELNNGNNDSVNSYNNATGLKIAISAKSIKTNPVTNEVENSYNGYEYAARTVLKFTLQHYRDGNGRTTTDGDSNLTMKDLRIWVQGGENTYGPNSSKTFPLAWGNESSKFKLMAGTHSNPNSTDQKQCMYGNWWWVSWDITTTTYIGFVAGNIDSESNSKGPAFWYTGDYLWTLIKDQYPLYPGETLEMKAYGDKEADSTKDYFVPLGAWFSFNKSKYFTR